MSHGRFSVLPPRLRGPSVRGPWWHRFPTWVLQPVCLEVAHHCAERSALGSWLGDGSRADMGDHLPPWPVSITSTRDQPRSILQSTVDTKPFHGKETFHEKIWETLSWNKQHNIIRSINVWSFVIIIKMKINLFRYQATFIKEAYQFSITAVTWCISFSAHIVLLLSRVRCTYPRSKHPFRMEFE